MYAYEPSGFYTKGCGLGTGYLRATVRATTKAPIAVAIELSKQGLR